MADKKIVRFAIDIDVTEGNEAELIDALQRGARSIGDFAVDVVARSDDEAMLGKLKTETKAGGVHVHDTERSGMCRTCENYSYNQYLVPVGKKK